jgi:hypothetical protein
MKNRNLVNGLALSAGLMLLVAASNVNRSMESLYHRRPSQSPSERRSSPELHAERESIGCG